MAYSKKKFIEYKPPSNYYKIKLFFTMLLACKKPRFRAWLRGKLTNWLIEQNKQPRKRRYNIV